MELHNDFRVSVPPAEAWRVLNDVPRIAPLLPGAQLQEVDGDEYRGVVKVKVGPIQAEYRGTASFVEQDAGAGTVVLQASGRDTKGQGNATATITAVLVADGAGTKVSVRTDLAVTGKVAQFGRGVLADVTGKLIRQFVDALEADIERRGGAGAPLDPVSSDEAGSSVGVDAEDGAPAPAGSIEGAGPAGRGGVAEASVPAPGAGVGTDPVDLLHAAGAPVAKRLLPAIGALVALVVVAATARRRGRGRAQRSTIPTAVAVPTIPGGAGDLTVRRPRAGSSRRVWRLASIAAVQAWRAGRIAGKAGTVAGAAAGKAGAVAGRAGVGAGAALGRAGLAAGGLAGRAGWAAGAGAGRAGSAVVTRVGRSGAGLAGRAARTAGRRAADVGRRRSLANVGRHRG